MTGYYICEISTELLPYTPTAPTVPVLEVRQIEGPAPAVKLVLTSVSECHYVDIEIDTMLDISIPEEAVPFKTISHIDTRTLDIKSFLIGGIASRRGCNGRKRTAAESSGHPEAAATLVPVFDVAVTVVDPPPSAPALEIPSVFDPTMFFGNVTSHLSVDTSFPITAFSQPIASASLPGFSSQTLVGGTSTKVPRALPLRERYIDSFYRNFYAAHPFIPPKELLLILAQQISLEPLLAAIRWIGSLYIEQDSSHSLFTDASRLIDGAPLRNGFLVQAMLLIIIGLDGNRQEKRARKLMGDAIDISIQIKLNSDPFAAKNGQGIPILEESWRRTWWELYVVDALMSGVHQTNTFVLYDVPADVGLPCEEHQYLTGQIPSPIHPYDKETLGLFDPRPYSSYTYRIQCACILGAFQKMPSEVDHIARLLANWMLRLPPSKYDAYCNGELDEIMFQAIMMWQAISILVHQPHSQLDSSLTYYIKASNTPAASSDAFNSHTKHTTRAARELAS
ncbi:Zn(II)2Cys6 transcriptional activator [Fusarium phyllophilum]|uniref:Zn(II)2Cys6 transcriptional activator n=1 Tax=Fusarium phyllophilum TaxID=47803 RepID=A0A8H5K7B3_9HYPO|nr:Zn(II)2Cys6 transcriptional activator [Fusarium phyllophilum]